MSELERLKEENEKLKRYNQELEALVEALTEELRLLLSAEANTLKHYLKALKLKDGGEESEKGK